MDAGAVRDAYLALDAQLRLWQARQAEGVAIVATLCDFHARLQLVATSGPSELAPGHRLTARERQFGALAADERLIDVLRYRHEVGVHNLIAALHRTIADLATVCDRVGALAAESWQRHGTRRLPLGQSAEPLWATVPGALGVALRERIRVPPVAQLLEDHLALCQSCSDELRLKRRVVARLSAGMSAAERRRLRREACAAAAAEKRIASSGE